jgi:NAD(P)-dependent dehydrogenase (short-subunit alcohol dehydrogenase family)
MKPNEDISCFLFQFQQRDMWHKTLAMEESDDLVKVLNYAPGAIETDMTEALSQSTTLDPELSIYYRKSKQDETYIQPAETANVLVNLIMDDIYKSGDHIDYWDV